MKAGIDPNLQYLADITRAFIRGGEPLVHETAQLDWARVQRLLINHQILPTVISVIRETGIPEHLLEQLEETARRLRIRSELLIMEVLRFFPTLEKVVDHAVLLKGIALYSTVYAHRASRQFVDIDMLVDRKDLETTCSCLMKFGFRRPTWLRAETIFYDRHHYHYVLQQPKGIPVEVHWDLSRPLEYVRFDLKGLVSRSRSVDVGGVELRIPDKADTLLHIASQTLYSGFSELRRVIDTALLLENCTEQDLRSVAERAHSQGVASALWILLGLTRSITGTPIPEELALAIRPPAILRACFGSLRLHEKMLAAFAKKRTGLRNLLVWLSAPDLRSSIRAIVRYLLPGDRYFLERGFSEDNIPGFSSKAKLSLQHGISILKLFAYLAWRLVTHPRMEI